MCQEVVMKKLSSQPKRFEDLNIKELNSFVRFVKSYYGWGLSRAVRLMKLRAGERQAEAQKIRREDKIMVEAARLVFERGMRS